MLQSFVVPALLLLCATVQSMPHHTDVGSTDSDRPIGAPFRLCVPDSAYESCRKMVKQGESVGVHISCVTARDRVECIEKIEHHQADWGAVDPEDMFIAANFADQYFSIFKEIRTKEEPNMEFRYEAVAVVHKDLDINNLEQLRGLKSCHTGVDRNVGYKIPITKLTKLEILDPLNDTTISPKENELKALSNFFSKACIVGKWSPDPTTNQRLKTTYANLCALCQFPEKCDYPDENSGYEGALRCLTKGGGQIAWTKTYYVKKVFGMSYGNHQASPKDVSPEDYAYLCPDATKKPLTGPPCTWAARPWQGYMANTEIKNELKELKEQITKLNNLGETSHAEWITTVLALNNNTFAADNDKPYSPKLYLKKAKYYDVIQRDVLKPQREVKICVTNDIEKGKCEDLQKAAYSRDIRPSFKCIQKSTIEKCLISIQNKETDIVSADAGYLIKATRDYSLEPIISEKYNDIDHHIGNYRQYVVAIVKKSSNFNEPSEKNKACVSHEGDASGYKIPVLALIKKNFIPQDKCPHSRALSEFFTAGVKESDSPLNCLESGEGDIAFSTYEDARLFADSTKGEYEILCDDKTRVPLNDVASVQRCSMAYVPARMWLANKNLSQVERDDILFALLSSGDYFFKNLHVFRIFGDYRQKHNVLFTNYAVGLVNSKDTIGASQAQEDYKKSMSELDKCDAAKHH